MLDRLLRTFAGSHGPRRLALLAWVLSLPALALGFQADDHAYAAARADGVPAWQLFATTGARMASSRELGVFAWWSSPRLAIDFFRPLASLNHWVEYGLFSNTPAVMSLVNTLRYAAIVAIAAILYRKLAPITTIAAFAGLMYAIDEPHAFSVGWISARNTLLAVVFSLAALLAHISSRERRSRGRQLASAACVALALLSAEAGSWSIAYLVAYTLTLDDRPRTERVFSLAPAFGVAAIWAVYHVLSGKQGVPGSEWYRELHHDRSGCDWRPTEASTRP